MAPAVAQRPGSNASRASSTQSKRSTYRVVSKNSEVDETLFGSSKPKGKAGAKAQVEVVDATASLKVLAPVETDCVTVSASEIQKMKQRAVILRDEDISRMKQEAQAEKNKTRAVAIARKERMLKMEEERKKRVPPTETEQIKNEKDQGTLSRAQYMLEEELDDVKHMNQMMLYSKCVTIRDAQIEEKKHIMEEEEEEDRKLDLMMEIERIKAIEAYEEREQKRKEDRMRGAAILQKQIEERIAERRRQEELRDQDKAQMKAELERMKEEEIQAQYEKRLAGQKLLAEVSLANAAIIERKKHMMDADKEENARIARYIRDRDLKEEAQAKEAERIAHEKELETARLRAQQEKVADRQSELDELRAIRAAEAYEREWRQKERAEMERKMAINQDLKQAREQQKQVKMKQLADQARTEQEDFYRVIAAQREQEQMERQQAVQLAHIRTRHKEEILNQIAQNDERRTKERAHAMEEGAKVRAKAKEESHRMTSIKDRKLTELTGMGVPSKYRAELERYKPQMP